MINWDFVNGVGDHIATLEKVNSAMNDEITRLRAEVERLRSFISTLDCRFTAGDMADIGGMHCPLGVPCARCKANITIEQLANAGIRLDEKAETWREKYLDQRDQIIERCAEVCDKEIRRWNNATGATAIGFCAAAIRAMKETKE